MPRSQVLQTARTTTDSDSRPHGIRRCSILEHGPPAHVIPHTTGASPTKAQLPSSKPGIRQSATAPATMSVSDESEFSGQHPPHFTAFECHTHITVALIRGETLRIALQAFKGITLDEKQ
ncbi:hypothetical protein CRG98_012332 [Punica granatum]|uniref:Uncharacterized protein n=1 Tax=Punica granatum TaxID=22663 RepID=A0A2I0KG13_PUNGR|nr:hypothetical protein CRG98_012332 [Punica granatum]